MMGAFGARRFAGQRCHRTLTRVQTPGNANGVLKQSPRLAHSAYLESKVPTRCQPQRGCVPSTRSTSFGRNQMTNNDRHARDCGHNPVGHMNRWAISIADGLSRTMDGPSFARMAVVQTSDACRTHLLERGLQSAQRRGGMWAMRNQFRAPPSSACLQGHFAPTACSQEDASASFCLGFCQGANKVVANGFDLPRTFLQHLQDKLGELVQARAVLLDIGGLYLRSVP